MLSIDTDLLLYAVLPPAACRVFYQSREKSLPQKSLPSGNESFNHRR
jgi:hypothetical protein